MEVHPGAILRDTILPKLKMNVLEAAYVMDISPRTLYRFCCERRKVTVKLANKLEAWLGIPADVWLEQQKLHDIGQR